MVRHLLTAYKKKVEKRFQVFKQLNLMVHIYLSCWTEVISVLTDKLSWNRIFNTFQAQFYSAMKNILIKVRQKKQNLSFFAITAPLRSVFAFGKPKDSQFRSPHFLLVDS